MKLVVPQYYPQTDSRTRHADRMCFSSSVAMAIKFLKPEALLGVNADDDYLKVVLSFGDTTSPAAHQAAVKEYGLASRFSTNGTVADLERIIGEGRPVPVGWLHHGTPSAPSGGGHWTLLTGIDTVNTWHHDPYGEADMVGGGYVRIGSGGKDIKYSRKNWLPRWQAGGQAWFLDVYDPSPSPKPSERPLEELLSYDGTFDSVVAVAKAKGALWPRVVAAQWALESGWGEKTSGRNNFFGLKGTPGSLHQTQEWYEGRFITISDTFRDYETPEDSIEDLIRLWYKDYKGYKGVNRASSEAECANLLRKEGYATDPNYPTKLLSIISEQS